MNKWIAIAAAVAVAATVFATGWWMDPHARKLAARPSASQVTSVAGAGPEHEKMFLEAELRKKPGHSPVLLRLGQIERESGNLEAARQHLEKAVAGDQKLVDARLELSLVCYQLGDIQASFEQNRAILHDNPKQPDVLYNLGAISANRGDMEAARDYWRSAVSAGAETPSGKKAAEALERSKGDAIR